MAHCLAARRRARCSRAPRDGAVSRGTPRHTTGRVATRSGAGSLVHRGPRRGAAVPEDGRRGRAPRACGCARHHGRGARPTCWPRSRPRRSSGSS